MNRSSYITPNRLAWLQEALTPVDWAMLRDVTTMRLAVASDLQRLRELDGFQGARRFRRVLARLTDWQVLSRLEGRRIGGVRAGSAAYVYAVGLAGQRLLLPGGDERVRRPWVPRPQWLAHALAVSHLYVELREAEAAGQLKLERFEAEPACWRTFTGPYGERLTLKPDAYVETTVGEYTYCRFIEMDCGTEGLATLARKFGQYERYWRCGQEQQRHGVFPEVLWVVPRKLRFGQLVDVAGQQPADTWQLYRVAEREQTANVFTQTGTASWPNV